MCIFMDEGVALPEHIDEPAVGGIAAAAEHIGEPAVDGHMDEHEGDEHMTNDDEEDMGTTNDDAESTPTQYMDMTNEDAESTPTTPDYNTVRTPAPVVQTVTSSSTPPTPHQATPPHAAIHCNPIPGPGATQFGSKDETARLLEPGQKFHTVLQTIGQGLRDVLLMGVDFGHYFGLSAEMADQLLPTQEEAVAMCIEYARQFGLSPESADQLLPTQEQEVANLLSIGHKRGRNDLPALPNKRLAFPDPELTSNNDGHEGSPISSGAENTLCFDNDEEDAERKDDAEDANEKKNESSYARALALLSFNDAEYNDDVEENAEEDDGNVEENEEDADEEENADNAEKNDDEEDDESSEDDEEDDSSEDEEEENSDEEEENEEDANEEENESSEDEEEENSDEEEENEEEEVEVVDNRFGNCRLISVGTHAREFQPPKSTNKYILLRSLH